MTLKDLHSTFKLLDGNKIPCLGFGTYKIDKGQAGIDTLLHAIELGYRHFDTASLYGTEDALGTAIKLSGIDRKKIFVTTKVWKDDLEPEKIRASVESSLEKLQLDYVDLLLIHWPRATEEDDGWEDRLAKAWQTFIELKEEGKTKSIGVANFLPHHFDALKSEAKPCVDQIEFHPGYMQTGAVDYCHRHNIVVEAWMPLGRGALIDFPVVKKIAIKHQVSAGQVLLRFCLDHEVLPLVKSSNIERIRQNADIFDFKLSEDELTALRAVAEKTAWSGEHPDLSIPKLKTPAK